ncbi:MAG TPA: LptA/OstA family protein [Nitrospira sp.]|nr:LptA/OstA family protein [Nitrospira sp.]
MWIWLLFLSLGLVNLASIDEAAVANAPKGASDQTLGTTVTSQKMTFKNQDSQAVFDGAVVLTRGTLVVYSDRMVVSFRGQEPGLNEPKKATDAGTAKGVMPAKGPDTVSNRAVSQIEATGRVKIERDAGNATCQKAVYYRDEDKIVLTGDPVAWDKGTRVSGKRITMFLAEDRTVVEGGSHVRIEPDEGAK